MSKLHFQPEIPLKSIFKNVFQTDYIPNYTISRIKEIQISIIILQLIVNEKSISNSQSLDMIKLPLG